MAALTGVKTIDMVNGEITKVAYNGAEYAKVENGQAGDIGVVTSEWGDQKNGEFYVVTEVSEFDSRKFARMDGARCSASCYLSDMKYFRKISAQAPPTIAEVNAKVDGLAERVTALESPKAEPLKVGDYAKVITEVDEHKIGDIVKITEINNGYYDFRVDRVGYGDYGFIFAKDIEKISDEEGEKAFKQAVRDAIFTKAGRNPNEYRKGDIVRYEHYLQRMLTEVTKVEGDKVYFYDKTHGNETEFTYTYNGTLKPVTFAESRLDLRK